MDNKSAERLACEIIEQAIYDYKKGLRIIGERKPYQDPRALEKFFKGPWCAVLLDLAGISRDWFLERIEDIKKCMIV